MPFQINGNPLQCSRLENPRDGEACWAAVYGLAPSRTRLKRLSSSRYDFNGRKQRELKSLLMKVKEETEKAGLKFIIQKTKIMQSDPIIAWQIDGKTMESATMFIFLGSKITVDGDCSHEIKGCLLLGRKAMTNLDSILKSRDINLPTKAYTVKAMVFPVVTDHQEG